MSNMQSYQPNFAVHPGHTLAENLEYLDISQVELSERTGLTTKHISNIINCKASITPETAIKLEKVLGISASFWNNLEKNYQATIAKIKLKESLKNEIKTILPKFEETYKELAKYNYVKKRRWIASNFFDILSDLQSFFGSASLSYINKNNSLSAFRKYKNNQKKINEYTIAAWLRLGEIKAQNSEIAKYDAKKLEKSLEKIRALSLKKPLDYLPEIEKVLADCGIVVVYAPYFSNTYTQGAAKWQGKDKAFIILKTTNQGEDKFWFNLFHEIAHILKHGKSRTFIDLEDNIESSEENDANTFAQTTLMPNFDKNEILDYGQNISKGIKKIAKYYGISKSIIAGRLSYEFRDFKEIYKITTPHIAKINYTNIEN